MTGDAWDSDVGDILADLAEVRELPPDRVTFRHSDGLVIVRPWDRDPVVIPLARARALTAARRAARKAATVERDGRLYSQLEEAS